MTAADHTRSTEPTDESTHPETDDTADDAPATSGHSDADTQTQRNADDESPS
jgi:hypothetical protein